jgi:2-oxo-3-hexenedioate decarboxylase
MSLIKDSALLLHRAQRQQSAVPQISISQHFDLKTAYSIQHEIIKKRLLENETYVGVKMGFTSEAKMKQMGVSEMIIGQLTDAMNGQNGGALSRNQFIHPRVEPEIAFRLKKDILEPITLANVLDYVEGIAGALEIIDSRYVNFTFSLEDVVADNCSSAAFVLGVMRDPLEMLNDLEISLHINEQCIETGSSNDILGNPWKSLVAASELACKYEIPLKAGHIVLAGAATSAHFIHAHDEIRAEVENMETVFFRMID